MLGSIWRLSKGYRLCPWRSPYLRWRIETHQGWHAERITARDFWRFAWTHRTELARFLQWADRNQSRTRERLTGGGRDGRANRVSKILMPRL